MKILDRYILTSYLKTFFSVFIILMFIFVLQTIWLYIGELAGKDLDTEIILKFLLYFSPKLVPLVLPLTILLTSIMTFGNFAENYEFAAMKSSGISLQRAMRGLTVFILLVSVTAFFFANNVIPAAEYKSINLRKNIAKLKPAMAITEGVFNDLGTINIKVEDKSGDNGRYLSDVIIHKKPANRSGNFTVIKAKEGELAGSTDSDVLSLVLKDGNYYDEVQASDYSKRRDKPFLKSYFEEYTINLDLSDFNNVDLEDESYDNTQGMLNISELRQSIDSFATSHNTKKRALTANMYQRTSFDNIEVNLKPSDSIKEIENTILEEYDTYQAIQIVSLALGSVNGALSHLNIKKSELKNSTKQLNKFEIALHEKYVLAVACIVLFFVGAPLGAIIRKGGMGLPMVVAILLFLTYHFIGIFAKNSAEDGSISPFIATWLSTLIMLPLGVYLTYRATTDQGLFAFENITEPIRKLLKKAGIIKPKRKID
ncbi:LptF/LptG family permease [Salegentibacter maritimus]|uniref:LptF/LptG family permease n=1 Tax=Salegentibacter maritimus TaxID=2794347 RepID=A0ABS0THS2_9FLAO|nr:LptF/LptG family permease [Salegentibacter maritimus]MBI6120578.1 LptF/LptG family permease [Salegentibacter maritimus]